MSHCDVHKSVVLRSQFDKGLNMGFSHVSLSQCFHIRSFSYIFFPRFPLTQTINAVSDVTAIKTMQSEKEEWCLLLHKISIEVEKSSKSRIDRDKRWSRNISLVFVCVCVWRSKRNNGNVHWLNISSCVLWPPHCSAQCLLWSFTLLWPMI